MTESTENTASKSFIHEIVEEDNQTGKFEKRVHTRFPPEPNGYLHIGHAKSICLNFGLAQDFGGKTNLRFDDTNPLTEDPEYVDSIKEDVRWLGFEWEGNERYASDYFDQLYEYATDMIKQGKAYVDDLSQEEMRKYRGTLTEPGKDSPHRNRSVEENLDLFERMKNGEFDEGSRVLRVKIDMAAPNMNLRDPVMYRIIKAAHHRTGDKWNIYPTYDWAHGQSDSIEGITHSICTLEFENNRPLYEWYLHNLEIFHSQQIEFARLNLTHTIMSKRKLLKLVEEGVVDGWDDPRMPTLSGLRRRGVTPEAIRNFCDVIGVAKTNSVIDYALFEHTIREDLDARSPRAMAVLKPLKLVIDNFPNDQVEEFEVDYYRHDKERSLTRKVPFSREVYIEQSDFMEEPPPKYFRLSPGREVRLMNACLVTCTDVVKNENGDVVEVHATYDPDSLGGQAPDGRRVKGTLHWVSAAHAVDAEVRLYNHLFDRENPDDTEEGEDFLSAINSNSLEIISDAKVEPALLNDRPDERFQFVRSGYFYVDRENSEDEKLVFNRVVSLRDSWAKQQKRQ
ncbi:MAG: glutamine--tRNA ligase/YqeY domain fusion protein [Chloroflexi bacterium]|nr:MAG: glutamine--tRNA ligase/YqeY domain fusion protein [Chloroflexota bacterium]MBL1196488.1 glutamine--tRNA ligase/YqeY domain fusion protein [Chloroflexota bacterium]NOH13783.1 glutamine--tRNA ligase/YqeY domain fusion protein [Chloroflexota bacterium]